MKDQDKETREIVDWNGFLVSVLHFLIFLSQRLKENS